MEDKNRAHIEDQALMFIKMLNNGNLDLADSHLKSVREKFESEYKKFIELKMKVVKNIAQADELDQIALGDLDKLPKTIRKTKSS